MHTRKSFKRRRSIKRQTTITSEADIPEDGERSESDWNAEYERMMDLFCFTLVFSLVVFALAVIVFAALPWNWHYWMEGMEEQQN